MEIRGRKEKKKWVGWQSWLVGCRQHNKDILVFSFFIVSITRATSLSIYIYSLCTCRYIHYFIVPILSHKSPNTIQHTLRRKKKNWRRRRRRRTGGEENTSRAEQLASELAAWLDGFASKAAAAACCNSSSHFFFYLRRAPLTFGYLAQEALSPPSSFPPASNTGLFLLLFKFHQSDSFTWPA